MQIVNDAPNYKPQIMGLQIPRPFKHVELHLAEGGTIRAVSMKRIGNGFYEIIARHHEIRFSVPPVKRERKLTVHYTRIMIVEDDCEDTCLKMVEKFKKMLLNEKEK